jgi:hypothetical protein
MTKPGERERGAPVDASPTIIMAQGFDQVGEARGDGVNQRACTQKIHRSLDVSVSSDVRIVHATACASETAIPRSCSNMREFAAVFVNLRETAAIFVNLRCFALNCTSKLQL